MGRFRLVILSGVLALGAFGLLEANAQTPRERARIPYRQGWELMRSEKFEAAVKAFQQSIDIDPTFEHGFYGLGRAHLALKQFVQATQVLERCRNLYLEQAGRKFTNAQEAQRMRQDQLLEIDEQIRLLNSARPTTATADLARQYGAARRNIEDSLQRGNSLTVNVTVPPWVSLSLGSAYFRSGKLEDAEREYQAAISADPRSGEAHSNLAVVYLETGRFEEADKSLKAAKNVGFKVNPQLEEAIRAKLRR